MVKVKPARKLKLPKRTPVREGVVVAFQRVLHYAIKQAHLAEEQPELSVYEFRKSTRRARAILKLLQPYLKRKGYDQLNGQLRTIAQRTSGLRDADVLLVTLDALPQPESQEEQAQREALHVLLSVEQQTSPANPSHDAPYEPALDPVEALMVDVELMVEMPDRLHEMLPQSVSWKQIDAGIIRTFKRARRDMYTALNEDDEAIHDWRKRIKALRYQLEMLSSLSKHDDLVRARVLLARLAQHLGQVTDKMVLRDYIVNTHPKSRKRYKVLIKRINRLYLAEFAYCMALCQAFFDEPPRHVVKRWTGPLREITCETPKPPLALGGDHEDDHIVKRIAGPAVVMFEFGFESESE